MTFRPQLPKTSRRLVSLTRHRSRGLHLVAVLLFLCAMCFAARATQSVRLSWDPTFDPTVVGYNVYYGIESGNYTGEASTGSELSVIISGLEEGGTYYFAVTSLDHFGQESTYSNEVSYTVPLPPPPLGIFVDANGATLTGVGVPDHAYEIQATTDFVSWTVIGLEIADADGVFVFTDFEANNYPVRFFRYRDASL